MNEKRRREREKEEEEKAREREKDNVQHSHAFRRMLVSKDNRFGAIRKVGT